jgi:dihydroneopterin aldolase
MNYNNDANKNEAQETIYLQMLLICLQCYKMKLISPVKLIEMGLIEIEGMEFYAYHGHFIEEQVVGNKFIVYAAIETNCTFAGYSDKLDDALDYQKVYYLIKKEMDQSSYLLENICTRILDQLYSNFKSINKATIKVSKLNPPMGGQIKKVSITMSR